MKPLFITLVGLFVLTSHGRGQQTTPSPITDYLKNNLTIVTHHVHNKLGRSKYLEEKEISKTTTLKGWESITVTLYEYHVKDKNGDLKKARVYLCDASDSQIAKWVVSACWFNKKTINLTYIDRILDSINLQSGGQFAVMGIVYEDMKNTGTNYPYVFKDGVTVYPAKFKLSTGILSDEDINKCLNLTDDQLKSYTGKYGRIANTTREDYKAAGGKDDVGSSSGPLKITWLTTVRQLYQKALKEDNNELITAEVKTYL